MSGTDVWLDLDGAGFRAEWYAHAIELRRRFFPTYRLADDFARRKAGKRGAILNNVPPALRVR